MTYPHTRLDDDTNKKSNFTYWKQNDKGEVLQLRIKPRRKHDSYCYHNGIIYLIWYEDFIDNFD